MALACFGLANNAGAGTTGCLPAQEDHGLVGLGRPGKGKPLMLLVTTRDVEANPQLFAEPGLTLPIVRQQQWQISRRYAMSATPIAYLMDKQGIIDHDVAVGTDAIVRVLARIKRAVAGTQQMAS